MPSISKVGSESIDTQHIQPASGNASVLRSQTYLQNSYSVQRKRPDRDRRDVERQGRGGSILTEDTEHDGSRGSDPGGQFSPAVVQPSLSPGHMAEEECGHRLCTERMAIPEPCDGRVVRGLGATREVAA